MGIDCDVIAVTSMVGSTDDRRFNDDCRVVSSCRDAAMLPGQLEHGPRRELVPRLEVARHAYRLRHAPFAKLRTSILSV